VAGLLSHHPALQLSDPTDVRSGKMILADAAPSMRPAHVHFLVNAPGHEPLITHVFIEGDKYLDSMWCSG